MIGKNSYNVADQILDDQPLMQFGSVGTVTLTANSYKDVNITFPEEYAEAPSVIVVINTSATTAQYGNITASATNITKTGFTLRRFLAADNSSQSPGAKWMAVGKGTI